MALRRFLLLLLTVVPAHAHAATMREIAWHRGDVDAAFAQARRENKPLFLYWGAVWCPPCNQVKATIFPRQDFVERARFFVPVYLDGDAPNAQKIAARFKVSAYPTMILFRSDGTELTRLPGEVDGPRYMQVLALGMNAGRPVKALLTAAQKGAPLAANDWRLLAFYSWETDHQALVPQEELAPLLWRLAQASSRSAPDASVRFTLKAASIAADAKDEDRSGIDKRVALARIEKGLGDAAQASANFDELTYGAQDVVGYLTAADTPSRTQLQRAWDRRLAQFTEDAGLARLDRLAAAGGRVALARLDQPDGALPVALHTEVRGVVLRALRDVTDKYEREAIVTSCAALLADADAVAESDALLQAELKRSATPYYLMLGLASNARKRGDNMAALAWYEQAYAAAQGPATRLQWGSSYVRALIDLAPQDAERIERAVKSVIADIEAKPETFYERNRSSLDRIGTKLSEWNKDGKQDAVLARLRAQLNAVCGKLPANAPERATCEGVLDPRRAKSAGFT